METDRGLEAKTRGEKQNKGGFLLIYRCVQINFCYLGSKAELPSCSYVYACLSAVTPKWRMGPIHKVHIPKKRRSSTRILDDVHADV
jgi:hypothetical protein